MINKILVAVGTTQQDQAVFDSAISLAQATKASLMLVHVLSEEDPGYPLLPTYAYYSVLKGKDRGIFQEKFAEYEQQMIKFLQHLTQKAITAKIDAEYSQLTGIPGWEICELASTWSADLIIVGSRGIKGIKGMFLGSISNYVTHHAPCSVLIVRADSHGVTNSRITTKQSAAEVDIEQQVATEP